MTTRHYLGVDLGSTTAKAVVIDGLGGIAASSTIAMGAVSRRGMQRAIDAALESAGLETAELSGTVSTGYGRKLVPGVQRTFTEITCHARGTSEMVPGVRLVIDVGGQDSKAITVGSDGLVDEFAMNDRCASGTGRFYEVLARALECEIDDLGALAMQGNDDLEISTMCATFAETEIVSLMAQDLPVADIASSVHRAIAARTLALVAQVGKRTPVVLTGGVARNPAAVHFLSRALRVEVGVPEQPQITGAYGAALLALEADQRGRPVQDVAGADHLFPRTSHDEPGHSCAGCDGNLAGPVDLGASIAVRR
ncbi:MULTISPECIES: acyl-CoA dehydratase activase [unclassified Nocardioides]|uniref:acyl-CoA dehydratase activase n=1 Tax=unclassified Nocardioides TaxID=2615069 RepID=UPI0006F317BA|nr:MULTISPECIES: acyl-CoA dehydratase activase [unclassified Nocardioides]KQY50868.1 benzoyl-CoA reductase [Nocardioides sp. Root140]KQZ75642.1 benzoyl-CoA reductase [Nocardioides sp. Root151]KRF14710.1 benzoyl-CoA reductase [Nocardioides sp. Soil796]